MLSYSKQRPDVGIMIWTRTILHYLNIDILQLPA